MKYLLVKPILSSVELSKLNFYADYLGYIFRFNTEQQSALFETLDKQVAYIQKDEYGHIFIVWKHNEVVEQLNSKIEICMHLHNIGIIPDVLSIVNLIVGMHRLAGTEINKLQYEHLCQR